MKFQSNLGPLETEAGELGVKPVYDAHESELPDLLKPYLWKFNKADFNLARIKIQEYSILILFVSESFTFLLFLQAL